MLDNLWPVVKAEAEKRGFQKPSTREDDQTPYFLLDDFDRAHRLLIDQRRRAEDRKRGLVPPVQIADYLDAEDYAQAMKRELERCPSRAKRVALLVRELEEASQHSVSDQALLHLLVSEGDNAVEPLLKCLESDTRLTRSLQEYKQGIYPAGVDYLAASASMKLSRCPSQVPDSRKEGPDLQEESRASHAARIRAYWKRYKDLPPEERWHGILADDRAPPYQWLAAAFAIVQPARVPVTLDSVIYGWENDWWRPDSKRKMHGEVLRKKTKPSVAELMAVRVKAFNEPYFALLAKRRKLDEQITKLDGQLEKMRNGPQREYDKLSKQRDELSKQRDELSGEELSWQRRMSFQEGCDMAFCLAQWAPAAALTILRSNRPLPTREWLITPQAGPKRITRNILPDFSASVPTPATGRRRTNCEMSRQSVREQSHGTKARSIGLSAEGGSRFPLPLTARCGTAACARAVRPRRRWPHGKPPSPPPRTRDGRTRWARCNRPSVPGPQSPRQSAPAAAIFMASTTRRRERPTSRERSRENTARC